MLPRALLLLTLAGAALLGAGGDAGRAGAEEAAAAPDQVNVRVEVGSEYDDNAHRAERIQGAPGPTIVASPLARGVAGVTAAGRIAAGQDVFASLLGAAKAFVNPDARDENVAVIESALGWKALLAGTYQLSAAGSYYEAIQAGTRAERELSGDARDFRSLTPVLRAGRLTDSGFFEAGGGYRWFVYKPLHGYDFAGPVAALEYRLVREPADGAADWEISAGIGAEFRRFAGARLVRSPAGCAAARCTPAPDPTGESHVDQFVSSHLDATYTGVFLLGAGYTLQWNRSNSYTESLSRHIGAIRVATELPWQFYLAGRAEFVYARYPDHVVLATGPTGSASASIDDENRNQMRVELSHALPHRLRLVARYSLYLNALGSSTVEYRRQTLTLSLTLHR